MSASAETRTELAATGAEGRRREAEHSPPRVSVVIPCFNLGAFLNEAIESVLAQTLQDFEILVVDDGSTEPETVHLLNTLNRPKTRVIRSENRGLSAARNLGVQHAVAPYVSALDADDQFEPEWLETAVTILESDSSLSFVSHWLETFGDEQGRWTPERCDLSVLLDRNVINGAALFRKSLVDAIGGFDESMRDGCEDWEFWLRAMAAGHRGTIVPEVMYRYQRRPDSMSRHMDHGRLYRSVIERHPDSFRENLLDLLLRREWAIAHLERNISCLETEIAPWTDAALEERKHELARASTRLDPKDAPRSRRQWQEMSERLADLQRRLDDASHQLAETRRSLSWRLTAPLRRAYEILGLGPRNPTDT